MANNKKYAKSIFLYIFVNFSIEKESLRLSQTSWFLIVFTQLHWKFQDNSFFLIVG